MPRPLTVASFLALGAPAYAGDLDAMLALDALSAQSSSTETAAGTPEAMKAQEMGIQARLDLYELDDRLVIKVDYRGREPMGGEVQNQALRLLYRGDVTYEAVEDTLELGAGRFMAPAVQLLPLDGVHFDLTPEEAPMVTLYGGRRGFTQTRRNLPLDQMFPAGGFAANWNRRLYGIGGTGGYATDQLLLLNGGAEEWTGGGHGNVWAFGYPTRDERLLVGGTATVAQQAAYFLGPSWTDVGIEVQALDLYQGLVYADYAPKDWAKIEYDVLRQSVGAYRAGTVEPEGEQLEATVEVVEPNFFDNRMRLGVRPLDRGWLRGEGRYRTRPVTEDGRRNETRLGGAVEVDDFGVKGPMLKAKVFRDFINAPEELDAADRLFWTSSAGWSDDVFDLEGGMSFIERATNPSSSRQADPSNSQLPTGSDDLSPFVLEAQDIAFLRAFYSRKQAFSGLDVEYNLQDGELRFFFQIGVIGSAGWGS